MPALLARSDWKRIKKALRYNHKTGRTLAALRDTLLPRLISGQLRLPEAETILEEAIA